MRTQVPRLGGRFLDADDVAKGRKVAFIGWKVATDLFGAADPVGQTIVINRIPFTVVGVLKKKIQDSMYNGPDADQVYLPFHSYRQIDNRRRINQIHIQPRKASQSQAHRRARPDASRPEVPLRSRRPLRHELLEHDRERPSRARPSSRASRSSSASWAP